MSEVVIVDWIGRGGIAQCSAEWLRVTPNAVLWTRMGREISGPRVTAFPVNGAGLRAHLGLVKNMSRALSRVRPSVVVIQNFLVPPADRLVHEAARKAGALVIFVVHDHQLHSLAAGTHLGLTGLLRSADVVAAHSDFVAEALRRLGVRSPDVLPLPIHHAVVDAPPGEPVVDVPSGRPLALHFGVVKRRYKGADVLRGLARMAGGGLWSFESVGVGATASENLAAVDRFWSSITRPVTRSARCGRSTQPSAEPRRCTGVRVAAGPTFGKPLPSPPASLPQRKPPDSCAGAGTCSKQRLLPQ